MAEEVTHQELTDLKMQMSQLSVKLDTLSTELNKVNVTLAKQDGANLPEKVKELEICVRNLESHRDNRAWMSDCLINVQTKVENLEFFKWKMIGILGAMQLVATVLGKFVLDSIWHPVVQVAQP